MRKYYPYLINEVTDSDDIISEKNNFLFSLNDLINQKRYVKITLLNWSEQPIKEIQGILTGGTINKDGSSSVRRSCSLQTTVDAGAYDIENVNMDFSINKKVFVEVGIKNETDKYLDYPILWFPQGVFYISSFSMSIAPNSALSINLSLKDKMSNLNGDLGGKFPSTIQLDNVEDVEDGQVILKKVKLYDIIMELVNHWGGEPLENIVIEDVDNQIKKVMKWNGDSPLYIKENGNEIEVSTQKQDTTQGWKSFEAGYDIGYILSDFVYTSELTMNAGETIVAALDKIKSYLGNYEYFYDEFGAFHFREIKNYTNTTNAKVRLQDMTVFDYLSENFNNKYLYTFTDNMNLINVSVNPQYNNIKNDFVVNGIRKSSTSDISYTIMYHLSINSKPETGNSYKNFIIYKNTGIFHDEYIAAFPLEVDPLPQVGDPYLIYKNGNSFFSWDGTQYNEITVEQSYYDKVYTTTDWRTDIYLQTLLARKTGVDTKLIDEVRNWFSGRTIENNGGIYWSTGYKFAMRNTTDYDEEIVSFWPTIYNILNQEFYENAAYDGNYFLDFIDPSTSGLGEFSIDNIGLRTDVVNNKDINCLFLPYIPDIIFLNVDDEDSEKQRETIVDMGYKYCQINSDLLSHFAIGGTANSAFEQIQTELWTHTNYQKQVQITALPAWYLEPNSYVELDDKNTRTTGNYVIKSISLPLAVGNPMSVTLYEDFNKI